MAQVVEIHMYGKQGLVCSAFSVLWLRLIWHYTDPYGQQPWYWPSVCGIFQFWFDFLFSHEPLCIVATNPSRTGLNSLRPSDAIWRQWSWTTLAQVMACCLTAPSHYLNQCWLIIRGVLWHTSESSFAGIAQGIDSGYEFEKDILKNIFKSPRGQWVNPSNITLHNSTAIYLYLTHLPWTKWPQLCRQHFEMHFLEYELFFFDSNFIKVCS